MPHEVYVMHLLHLHYEVDIFEKVACHLAQNLILPLEMRGY
jgi:hypothetical protein